MLFFVLGVDGDGVQGRLEELSEAHWAYMDRFADRLVARGPTLSPDGEVHTGSVHVVEVADPKAAQRFALGEPFWAAGLYASLVVNRFYNGVGGTMWDRPQAEPGAASSLVLVRWPGEPAPAELAGRWRELIQAADLTAIVFGGLLLSDDGAEIKGLVLAADVSRSAAEQLAAQLSVPAGAEVSVRRWQRGGRPELSGSSDVGPPGGPDNSLER